MSSLVMPFAGIINKPDDKTSEFAKENFLRMFNSNISKSSSCNDDANKIFINISKKFFKILQDAIQKMRELMNYVRKSLMEIVKEVMNRILNVVISLRSLLINFKSVFDKIKAALVSIIYNSIDIFCFKIIYGSIFRIDN